MTDIINIPGPVTVGQALTVAANWEAAAEKRDGTQRAHCLAQAGRWMHYALLADTDPNHPDLPTVPKDTPT